MSRTDQGEAAVYEGSDPGSVNTWARVGVYTVGRPRGKKAFVHRGGDLLIATDVGFVPFSSVLQRDASAVALSAISAPIEDEWRGFVRLRPGEWHMETWTANQMLAIALPVGIDGSDPLWLVANARTNKWCIYTGWKATCLCVHGDRMFFGSSDGIVYEANVGASDDGNTYTGIYVPVFDQLGAQGGKVPHMVRPVTRATGLTNVAISTLSDFIAQLPPPPDAVPQLPGDAWGSARWGTSKWGSGSSQTIVSQPWMNTSGAGEVISIAHQVTSSGIQPSDVEFIRTDVLFTVGEQQS